MYKKDDFFKDQGIEFPFQKNVKTRKKCNKIKLYKKYFFCCNLLCC